ncbi:MAG: prepilin-type N-terminal cleavage/methylation domain-containing protein [Deltaproteobacteria bacterium]|nr:prepilin-type N-terminal cleavage/methylation domain-containing protein [Deltaproteobacteria bacterium]
MPRLSLRLRRKLRLKLSKNKSKALELLFNDKGVTLIELIIAVVISLLVLAAASFILLSQSGVFRSQNSISTEQQNLNVAYNKLKYSLRLAGFDYGSNYFYASQGVPTTQVIPPVQIVPANYPTSPFAVLITNFSVINNGTPCTLTTTANLKNAAATSAEFNLGQNCNIANFTTGQLLSFQNATPIRGKSLSGSLIFCITNVQATGTGGKIQLNPGNGSGVCPNNPNPIPPNGVATGNVSMITQTMFYWGNTAYNFNAPFNESGGLYECQINPPVLLSGPTAGYYQFSVSSPASLSGEAPACYPNTTMRLDNYITEFSVNPLPTNLTLTNSLIQGGSVAFTPVSTPPSIYLYNLLIQGETNTVISDSPNYSVNSKYNANSNSSRGYNIDETLNSNVFLRNVYYGS